MELKIGKGIGELEFGMPYEKVIELIGQPDETETPPRLVDFGIEFKTSDDKSVHQIAVKDSEYIYHALDMKLKFNAIGKLYAIDFYGENVFFEGKKIMGMRLEEINHHVMKNKHDWSATITTTYDYYSDYETGLDFDLLFGGVTLCSLREKPNKQIDLF